MHTKLFNFVLLLVASIIMVSILFVYMDKQQFLDKLDGLKSPANAELGAVLKLWLLEGKSDDEIAAALGKNRSTATRKIGDICKYFGTDTKGKKEQRQQLVLLFRRYCSDFEVHSSLYPDWIEPNSIATKPENIVSEVVPIAPIASTEFDLLGRDADRQKLTELSKQHKLVLLKAAAGIGKSTLARHFLETQFTKVIRLEMGLESGNVTPAEEKVSQILRKEFDEEPSRDFQTNLEILKEKLSDKSRPIGVLIDNLEPSLDANFRFLEKLHGYEDLLRILGDRDVCSFTLITSRIPLIVQRVKVHQYLLQGLDIEAWRQYFHDCEKAATSEDLEQMCVAYNGNAKVMDILHGAITNRFDGNITAYWNRYKDALLADAELENLISVEMDWLRDNQPDAYKLLCRMGCYRYQDVKTVPFEGLICLLWDVTESQRVMAVEYLSKSCLIEIKDEYFLHPAIREAAILRLQVKNEEWKMTNIKAAEYWTNSVSTVETVTDALKAFEAYYEYLAINEYQLASDILLKRRKPQGQLDENLGSIFFKFGLIEPLKFSVHEVINNISTIDNLSQLNNILGDIYWLEGNIHRAIDHHKQAKKLAIESDLKGIEIISLFNIGLAEIDVCEIELATNYFEKCIQISEDTNYKVYIANSYACLSFLSSILGLREQAINFMNKVFQEIDLTNQNSWSIGYRFLFLGKTYINLMDLVKASEMYNNTLIFAKDSYYPQVEANALIGLATIARLENDLDLAISRHYVSVEILQKIGAKCDLAEAYFQLGLTYQAMEEHDQAETYKVKALELFKEMKAPKQIERVNQAFEQGAKQ